MEHTETITRAINFRIVGSAGTLYSRCSFPVYDGNMVWNEPTDKPHRWVVADSELEWGGGRIVQRAKFRCLRCGEHVYEERYDYKEDWSEPETVVPWP